MNNIDERNEQAQSEILHQVLASWVVDLREAYSSLSKDDRIGYRHAIDTAVDSYFKFMTEQTRKYGLKVYDAPNEMLRQHLSAFMELSKTDAEMEMVNETIRSFRARVENKVFEKMPALTNIYVSDPIYLATIYNFARPSDLVQKGKVDFVKFLGTRVSGSSKEKLKEARTKALAATIEFYETCNPKEEDTLKTIQELKDERAIFVARDRAFTLRL